MMMDQHPKDYYNRRLTSLKTERQSFIDHWMELNRFVKPRAAKFLTSDRNKGDRRWQEIINSKATQALKISTAGLLSGTISPTRPWFSLQTQDTEKMEVDGVKEWLYDVEQIIRAIFNESNFYVMAPILYSDLLLFGSPLMTHINDFHSVARFYTHPVGSFMLASNDRCEVDTVYREFEWTAGQIVKAFGTLNISQAVKNAYDKSNYDAWFPVCHVIEPNEDVQDASPLSVRKPFRSTYFEPGNNSADKDKWLSLSGFNSFPAYAPRWDVIGEDVYATDCPGMTALGDIKALQIEEKRKAQAIDKMVSPPLVGPASVRNVPVNSLPGGLTIYEGGGQDQELKPLYQVQPQLGELRLDMQAVEQRIDKAFFVDMFLAITNIEGIQPRNQLDLIQRNEERLLQLGPVLERLQTEFLGPLIDRTFDQALAANIIPPPPQALAKEPLKVKYISTLAIAQQAVATQSIERMSTFVGNLVALGWTDAGDKFNPQGAVEEYSKAIVVPPKVINSNDVANAKAADRAKQQELQQKMAMMEQGANVAATASKADTGGRNLLADMVKQ